MLQIPHAQLIAITFEDSRHIEDVQLHLHILAFHLQLTLFLSFNLILISVWEFLNISLFHVALGESFKFSWKSFVVFGITAWQKI